MADWAAFAGVGGVVTFLVLLLAHASRSVGSGDADGAGVAGDALAPTRHRDGDDVDDPRDRTGIDDPAGTIDDDSTKPAGADDRAEPTPPRGRPEAARRASGAEPSPERAEPRPDGASRESARPAVVAGGRAPSSTTLLLNVAATQAFFGLFLLGGVWYARVPLSALGIAGVDPVELLVGAALGVVLFVANKVGSSAGRRLGVGGGERLRAALAPETRLGWAFLLLVALPVVAGFEELLFRGVLVGGLATGFGVSPWPLAALSSVAFALGHGAQGRVGVVVTGALGFVFAAAFVATGSLLVVALAHYLVNALEFVVFEGVGVRM